MKGIALMSDGIDSPVAAYLMAKKEVEVVCLFGRNTPETKTEKVKRLADQIRKASEGAISIQSFDHFIGQEEIAKTNPKWLHCVLCKRMMVRTASTYAKKAGAEFIIMGDSMGQVASQTLANIISVEEASQVPIIRPLIGLDKREIEDIARIAGLYEISIKDQKECPYVPKGPSIKSRIKELDKHESQIDMPALMERILDSFNPL